MPKSQTDVKDDLHFQLGLLVDPLRRLFDDPDLQRKLPHVEAQFSVDLSAYVDNLRSECISAGIVVGYHLNEVHNAVCGLRDIFTYLYKGRDASDVKRDFDVLLPRAIAAIKALPCNDAGIVIEGESPLATFRKLVALIRGAQRRVNLFDPWLDKEVYLRYFDDVDPAVRITVVTAERLMQDVNRRDRIVAVSELLAIERRDAYEFRVVAGLHDRHLRIDDGIYHLGGSVRDAGRRDPYTISNLDPTAANHNSLDALIACGVEWFGPNVPRHRTQV
jgi:hypothetical protein